jgi:hypothetical protein
MQEKNDHLEFSQNSSIARKLKKHKIAVILGYKENHFKVNTHKPAPLPGQWKNPPTQFLSHLRRTCSSITAD